MLFILFISKTETPFTRHRCARKHLHSDRARSLSIPLSPFRLGDDADDAHGETAYNKLNLNACALFTYSLLA